MNRAFVKRVLFLGLRTCGVNAAMRFLHRRHVMVITYHGVLRQSHAKDSFGYHNTVSIAEFDRHLRFLRRHFNLLGITDLRGCVRGKRTLPRRAAIVTFDDGYRNNLMHAAPLLLHHRVPAVVFLSTGYIGERRILWPVEIVLRVLQWPLPRIVLPGEHGEVDVPRELHAKRALADRVCRMVKRLAAADAAEYLGYLRSTSELDAQLYDDDLHAFMNWDEVRELNGMGVEIGAHTVEHTILSRLSAEDAQRELRQSKERIEQETGAECFAMAYPNGTRADFTPAVIEAVRRAGYDLAFTVTNDFQPPGGDPLAFDRIVVPGHVSQELFEAHASGSFRMIDIALGRRTEAAGV